MRKYVCFTLFAFFFACLLPAQAKKSSLKDKWEVFAGYTLTRDSGDYNGFGWDGSATESPYSSFNLNGGEVSVSYFPTHHFGITFDFDSTTKDGTEPGYSTWHASNTMQHYLIGPVYRHDLNRKFSLYGHTLIGAAHLSADEYRTGVSGSGCNVSGKTCTVFGPAVFLGGGVDYKLSRRIKIRPAQLDYWMHSYSYNDFAGITTTNTSTPFKESATGLRYSVGAVFAF